MGLNGYMVQEDAVEQPDSRQHEEVVQNVDTQPTNKFSLPAAAILVGMGVVLVGLVGFLGYLVYQNRFSDKAKKVTDTQIENEVAASIPQQYPIIPQQQQSNQNQEVQSKATPVPEIKEYQYAASTLQQQKNDPVEEIAVYGDGQREAPYVIADPGHVLWQQYQHQNLDIDYDYEQQLITVSWDNPEAQGIEPVPYTWLIGYWYEPFDIHEKFHIEKLTSEEMIEWAQLDVGEIEGNPERLSLSFPTESLIPFGQVYFTMYVRIEEARGELVDLVYSPSEGSAQFVIEINGGNPENIPGLMEE